MKDKMTSSDIWYQEGVKQKQGPIPPTIRVDYYVGLAGIKPFNMTQGQRRYFVMMARGDLDVCYICNIKLHDLIRTIDHVTPISRGGSRTKIDNMKLCCLPCNQDKADGLLDEHF